MNIKKKIIGQLSVFVCVSMVALGASAGTLQDGLAHYKHKRYAQAHETLTPLAQTGNAEAQNTLGLMYANGLGVARDDSKATRLFRAAARKGHKRARQNLRFMIANGRAGNAPADEEDEGCD